MINAITGVLAASDLQHGSPDVLAAAATIARMTDARLHVAHVFTPAAVPRKERARDPEVEEDVLEEARRGLRLQAETVSGSKDDLASAVAVRRRSIHEGIVEVARAAAVDLIVLGSHARSSTSYRLGSTADRVVRTTPVPCLIVRGELRFPIHSAAVLTDFSPGARTGLSVALSWLPTLGLADPEGRLDVIHVGWPETPADEGGAPSWMVRKVQKEIVLASAGVSRSPRDVRPRVLFSAYPADAMVELARSEGYQLLVVATHGRGAVARALIGSVTLGLLHAAPCPVLVVPRPRRGSPPR
jgi:nucleotide-binding universal stress UspA family protein